MPPEQLRFVVGRIVLWQGQGRAQERAPHAQRLLLYDGAGNRCLRGREPHHGLGWAIPSLWAIPSDEGQPG
jgi:hypothetical protein